MEVKNFIQSLWTNVSKSDIYIHEIKRSPDLEFNDINSNKFQLLADDLLVCEIEEGSEVVINGVNIETSKTVITHLQKIERLEEEDMLKSIFTKLFNFYKHMDYIFYSRSSDRGEEIYMIECHTEVSPNIVKITFTNGLTNEYHEIVEVLDQMINEEESVAASEVVIEDNDASLLAAIESMVEEENILPGSTYTNEVTVNMSGGRSARKAIIKITVE